MQLMCCTQYNHLVSITIILSTVNDAYNAIYIINSYTYNVPTSKILRKPILIFCDKNKMIKSTIKIVFLNEKLTLLSFPLRNVCKWYIVHSYLTDIFFNEPIFK